MDVPAPGERRLHARSSVLKPAVLRVAPKAVIDCVVCNLSEGGALIEVREGDQLPERFRLLHAGEERACAVVRWVGRFVAVRFLG